MSIKLGNYFVVTSGYSENGGLVSKRKEALLFLATEGESYRQATPQEIIEYLDRHPVLRTNDNIYDGGG